MSLHLGVARVDITPPVGIPMVGFAAAGPVLMKRCKMAGGLRAPDEGELSGLFCWLKM